MRVLLPDSLLPGGLPPLGRARRGRVDKLVAVRGHPRDLAPVPLGLGRRLLVLLGVVEPQAEAQRRGSEWSSPTSIS